MYNMGHEGIRKSIRQGGDSGLTWLGWGGDSRSQLPVADTLCHDIFAGILSWFVFVCCAVFVVWYFSTRVNKGTWTSSKTTAAMTMERTVSLFFSGRPSLYRWHEDIFAFAGTNFVL